MDYPNDETDPWYSIFPTFDPGLSMNDDQALEFWELSANLDHHRVVSEPVQAEIKRHSSKSYTGCVTCRQRKIKCDGRRPFCKNCERARHYQCQGFPEDIGSGSGNENPIGPRKRRRLGREDGPGFPNPSHRQVSPTRHTLSHSIDPALPAADHGLRGISPAFARATPIATPATSTADTECHRYDGYEPHQANCPAEGMTISEGLDIDLLAYFQDTVCPKMLPSLDSMSNPWLQIYVPMALSRDATRGRSALRHALMSVAAFHLAQRHQDAEPKYNQRGKDHQEEAVRIITDMLPQVATESGTLEKCTLLAAALTLITTHIWGSDRTDCTMYVNLAKRLAKATGSERFWKSGVLSNILFQLLRGYDLMAASSRPQLELTEQEKELDNCEDPSNSTEDQLPLQEDPHLQVPYILDTSFGIASQTMPLLHRTVQLASLYASHDNTYCRDDSLLKRTEELARDIYSIRQDKTAFAAANYPSSQVPFVSIESALAGRPSPRTSTQENFPKAVCNEIAENYRWAFHHAVSLYFHRVVPSSYYRKIVSNASSENGGSSTSGLFTENCQSIVQHILDHLENIDCLTDGSRIRPSVTLWPAFIASVEAIDLPLRHRAMIWFSKACQKGIGNIPRAKEIVMATWRETNRKLASDFAVERGLSPVDWRDVMRDSGSFIMLA